MAPGAGRSMLPLYPPLTIGPAKSAYCGAAANRDFKVWPMAITDIPMLSMLRTRLQWSQERQRVLAENVANADTPSYRARDLVPPKFEAPAAGAAAPVTTVSLT